MAFSSQEGKGLFKDWLINFAKPLGYKLFLDVGCGAGSYGNLIREVYGKDSVIHAVEPFIEYIERHSLLKKYDNILMKDIRYNLDDIGNYDIIIAGDILEHMTKEDAIKVVNNLSKKCRFFWGALPLKMDRPWSYGYNQSSSEWVENPLNQHLHDWTGNELVEEFKPMWIVPYIQTGTFLIEGEIK